MEEDRVTTFWILPGDLLVYKKAHDVIQKFMFVVSVRPARCSDGLVVHAITEEGYLKSTYVLGDPSESSWRRIE